MKPCMLKAESIATQQPNRNMYKFVNFRNVVVAKHRKSVETERWASHE
jgi:hypothetical protein